MVRFFKVLCSFLRRLLIPPFCASCSRWLDNDAFLCFRCRALIKPVIPVPLKITSTITTPVYAVSLYRDPLKSLILAKSHGQRLASKQLGQLIIDYIPVQALPFDYIVPIPLHWTRYAVRGYNQA